MPCSCMISTTWMPFRAIWECSAFVFRKLFFSKALWDVSTPFCHRWKSYKSLVRQWSSSSIMRTVETYVDGCFLGTIEKSNEAEEEVYETINISKIKAQTPNLRVSHSVCSARGGHRSMYLGHQSLWHLFRGWQPYWNHRFRLYSSRLSGLEFLHTRERIQLQEFVTALQETAMSSAAKYRLVIIIDQD